MNHSTRTGTIVGVSCLAILVVSVIVAGAEDQNATDAANGRALSGMELNAIYENRSWAWPDGAAFFSPHNRAFTAWVGKDANASYADGSWSVNDQGRLCFNATWHNIEGAGPSRTCFEHRTDEKTIYQRKLPDGNWYVFSHIPPLPEDEVQKIQQGDQISKGFQTNKGYLAEHKDQVAKEATNGRPLTTKEISEIYEDRSWSWKDGAAYFATPKRAFIAWVDTDSKPTYADGSWSANDQGHLCFSATWHSRAGKGPSTTCFDHRADAKNIYQRKLPDGKWYIFSHLPALPTDEIQKLKPGDHVSEAYEKNKRYVLSHADKKNKRKRR